MERNLTIASKGTHFLKEIHKRECKLKHPQKAEGTGRDKGEGLTVRIGG